MRKNLFSCFRLSSFAALTAILVPGCKTGSNYEKLKAVKPATAMPAATAGAASATYLIRPFTFVEMGDRTDMFRKAFIFPGYKGIDFDSYGRMDPSDQKSGMKTLYSLPDVHALVADELAKLEVKTSINPDGAPEDAVKLDVRVLGSESSLRMHTYGCWPVVGAVVYIFNADIYTVVTRTRLEYSIGAETKTPRKGTFDVYSEMDFSFWGSYMGFGLYEAFNEARDAHLKQIAADLAVVLRK
jgi:hypothetical protein